ncbi:alpha/beta hydrolase [Aldersonia sp. NBC_00410]|uniref:alpha/beta hydrolase family protein n=1 Tax=Aldersonia sp. NBC_00410 TaxID=2975954 RepID=UPI00225286E8|nr:alpha/beta family hydrolase [Aldersonia sp. NBC_00410]MCX5042086.1 alpha/beta hydrolase [Aldersonia sp. NBC_00410]
MDIETIAGPARIHLDTATDPAFLLVLTHGAGGGVDSSDLLAVRSLARDLGGVVARVLQPYRVAGGRAPGSATRQDAAWLDVITALRERVGDVPLIQGGRSNGARVVCRTAAGAGATGVICLAYPLHPPGKPEKSRADELRAARPTAEAVVLNGDRDPFGIPDATDAALVHVLSGETHALKKAGPEIVAVLEPWLRRWSGQH